MEYPAQVRLPQLLFVHSPLVGPSSLRALQSAATTAGYETVLPDLTSIAHAPSPHHRYVQLAADAGHSLSSPIVLVGHSGAGAFLSRIGAALSGAVALV